MGVAEALPELVQAAAPRPDAEETGEYLEAGVVVAGVAVYALEVVPGGEQLADVL